MAHLIRKYAFPSDTNLHQRHVPPSRLPNGNRQLDTPELRPRTYHNNTSDYDLPEPSSFAHLGSHADLYFNRKPGYPSSYYWPEERLDGPNSGLHGHRSSSSGEVQNPSLPSLNDLSYQRTDLRRFPVDPDRQRPHTSTISNNSLQRLQDYNSPEDLENRKYYDRLRKLPSPASELDDMAARGMGTLRLGGADLDAYRTTYAADFRSHAPGKHASVRLPSRGSMFPKRASVSDIASDPPRSVYESSSRTSLPARIGAEAKREVKPGGYGSDEYYLRKLGDLLNTVGTGITFNSSPTPITDYMYIGGYRDAENLKGLQEHGITHVLNCAANRRTCVNPYPPESGIVGYESFDADDLEYYDMMQHWERGKAFIDRVKAGGGKVLVHCAMGVNRSGFICCAYLMSGERLSLLEAARRMKQRRITVLCNPGFQRQLLRFARLKGYLG